jgi:hypothetical protein
MVTSTIALALETMIDRRLKRPNQWRAQQQLARCRARYVTPRRATNATRLALVWPRALVRLAAGLSRSATRDVSPLTLVGIPPVLALEVHPWTLANSSRPVSAHPPYSPREPNRWRGADCQRAVAEAWSTGVATHRAQIYAQALGPWSNHTRTISELADICP